MITLSPRNTGWTIKWTEQTLRAVSQERKGSPWAQEYWKSFKEDEWLGLEGITRVLKLIPMENFQSTSLTCNLCTIRCTRVMCRNQSWWTYTPRNNSHSCQDIEHLHHSKSSLVPLCSQSPHSSPQATTDLISITILEFCALAGESWVTVRDRNVLYPDLGDGYTWVYTFVTSRWLGVRVGRVSRNEPFPHSLHPATFCLSWHVSIGPGAWGHAGV